MTSVLVVFSGGQDSTTCLGFALQNYEKVGCITFDYGQRHSVELEAAIDVVCFFERKTGRSISHEIVKLPDGILSGSSPLINPGIELERYENNAQMEAVIGTRIEKTFVPMRNALFLMIAANRAAVEGYDEIMIGVCEADNANYPDCRGVFVESAETTINRALGRGYPKTDFIEVRTPLLQMTKTQSVNLARTLPHTYAALAFSHTAYDGAFPPANDHASVLRAHGFEEAGWPDPLILRAYYTIAFHNLPSAPNYDSSVVIPIFNELRKDW